MQEVTIAEAKAHLTQLVEKAEHGEAIAITRNGKAVAHITPAPIIGLEKGEATASDQKRHKTALEEFLRERATWPRTNITKEEILALRHEGHRL
jgi:prevent-host-death family protein